MRKVILFFLFFCMLATLCSQTWSYEEEISSLMTDNEAFKNVLSLWFTEAETGLPIVNADIEIGKKTFKTDEYGLIYFKIPKQGIYNFLFSKLGYVSIEGSFEIAAGTILYNKISVPKMIEAKHIKIVLDWGENPSDLDVHFVKTGQYHISYRDMKKNQDGTVWLDRDDMSGYGPEAITVTEFDNMGTYRFFAHNYSQQSNRSDTGLSSSNAIVRVYLDNQLKHTFRVPQDMSGIFWNVFDIKNSVILPIDTVTDKQRP